MILKINLPPEFIALCRRDEVKPEIVIRSFIADLAIPDNALRKDGYQPTCMAAREAAFEYYGSATFPTARDVLK